MSNPNAGKKKTRCIINIFWNMYDFEGRRRPAFTKWCSFPKFLKVYSRQRLLFEVFISFFNNKTLNVPHDTTFCMENNAKTLIIHGYKFVITWHNSNGHTCNGIYIFFENKSIFNSAYSSPPGTKLSAISSTSVLVVRRLNSRWKKQREGHK